MGRSHVIRSSITRCRDAFFWTLIIVFSFWNIYGFIDTLRSEHCFECKQLWNVLRHVFSTCSENFGEMKLVAMIRSCWISEIDDISSYSSQSNAPRKILWTKNTNFGVLLGRLWVQTRWLVWQQYTRLFRMQKSSACGFLILEFFSGHHFFNRAFFNRDYLLCLKNQTRQKSVLKCRL